MGGWRWVEVGGGGWRWAEVGGGGWRWGNRFGFSVKISYDLIVEVEGNG